MSNQPPSDPVRPSPARLEGFDFFPEEPSAVDPILTLWTASARFDCVLDRVLLRRLAGEARTRAEAFDR